MKKLLAIFLLGFMVVGYTPDNYVRHRGIVAIQFYYETDSASFIDTLLVEDFSVIIQDSYGTTTILSKTGMFNVGNIDNELWIKTINKTK